MGRPSKLTPQRADNIIKMVRGGAYPEVAAQANGVHRATFYDWMARGRNAERQKRDQARALTAADQPYVDFHDSLKDAEAAAEVQSVVLIRAAANGGTWQAAAWYLERKYPDRWARKDFLKQEVSGPANGPVGVEVDAKAELLAFFATKRDEQAVEAESSEPGAVPGV